MDAVAVSLMIVIETKNLKLTPYEVGDLTSTSGASGAGSCSLLARFTTGPWSVTLESSLLLKLLSSSRSRFSGIDTPRSTPTTTEGLYCVGSGNMRLTRFVG